MFTGLVAGDEEEGGSGVLRRRMRAGRCRGRWGEPLEQVVVVDCFLYTRWEVAGIHELRRAIGEVREGDSFCKQGASDEGNWGNTLGFYRGSGEARGERGVAGINVFNGCSMKRSWWPLWLSRRRTRGWKRSRESRGFHSEGFWGDVIGRGQKFTMFYTTKRCASDDIPQQRRTQNKANRLELP